MSTAVITVASGGLAVTKIAAGGLPVTFVVVSTTGGNPK